MKKNMGTIDRGLRIALAALVLVLFLTHTISGTAAIILGAVAVVLLLTSFVGVCPAYLPFGLSTAKK
ncbi:MAG: YgaP family membrane protein [Candidatus Nanopelagicales bacterium]